MNPAIYSRKNFISSIIRHFVLSILKSFMYSVHTFSINRIFYSKCLTYALHFHVSTSNCTIFRMTVWILTVSVVTGSLLTALPRHLPRCCQPGPPRRLCLPSGCHLDPQVSIPALTGVFACPQVAILTFRFPSLPSLVSLLALRFPCQPSLVSQTPYGSSVDQRAWPGVSQVGCWALTQQASRSPRQASGRAKWLVQDQQSHYFLPYSWTSLSFAWWLDEHLKLVNLLTVFWKITQFSSSSGVELFLTGWCSSTRGLPFPWQRASKQQAWVTRLLTGVKEKCRWSL